jgi:hypothetical protein
LRRSPEVATVEATSNELADNADRGVRGLAIAARPNDEV